MFEDERGWIRRLVGEIEYKRIVLIFTKAGYGRGMHLPFDCSEARRIAVWKGSIMDYVGYYEPLSMDGDESVFRDIPPNVPHGFLSVTDSLVVYASTHDYFEPRVQYFPIWIYDDWKFSEKDTPK